VGGVTANLTTIGRWLDLPAARFQADKPLGSGLVQIVGSNAELAARENNLRTLWEHPGSSNIYADLPLGGVPFFDWDTDASAGRFTAFCGVHRVRPHGSSGLWPKLVLRARGLAPSTYTLGLILVALPAPGLPSVSAGLYDTITTTATSLTDLTLSLSLDSSRVGQTPIRPRLGHGAITTVDEAGEAPSVALYLGAWCTSGGSGSKAELHEITLYLAPP